MTIWGSFNTSKTAMNAHSHQMDQIGTNIANMNTTAYKEVETHYHTVMSVHDQGEDLFSANPIDTRRVSVQGTILSSTNSYDLAINGQGFFVTNSNAAGTGDTYYTRDGNFGTRSSTLSVDTDGDGQNDQVSYLMTQSGDYLMGWAADGNGGYDATLSAITVNHNSILAAEATTEVILSGNIPNDNGSAAVYNSTINLIASNADGSEASSNNLVINWSKGAGDDNTWDLAISGDSNVASATISPATAVFNSDGTLDTTNGTDTYTITVSWNDGSEESTVTLDLSGMTQYASTEGFTVDSIESDGYLEGRMVKTTFDEFGVLSGYYDNNRTLDLYKLPLATFVAPDSLEAVSGNRFQATTGSGDVTLRSVDSRNSVGIFVPSSLENSNVVLEDQFSRMITTQKAYTMASTAFRTADEMLQEVRDMKR